MEKLAFEKKQFDTTVTYNHVRAAHASQFKVPVGSQLKKEFMKDKKKSFFSGPCQGTQQRLYIQSSLRRW
jgi:hypothetical protein